MNFDFHNNIQSKAKHCLDYPVNNTVCFIITIVSNKCYIKDHISHTIKSDGLLVWLLNQLILVNNESYD